MWKEKDLGEKSLECSEPGKAGTARDQGFGWGLLTKNTADDWLYESAQNFKWKHAAGHDGEEAGTQTQVIFFPEEKMYALVFTNTGGNTDKAAQNLMKDLLKNAPSVINQGRATPGLRHSNHEETRVRPSVEDRHNTTKQRPVQRTKTDTRGKEGPLQHPRGRDTLDEAMEAVMEESKIRGAAVAYFNKMRAMVVSVDGVLISVFFGAWHGRLWLRLDSTCVKSIFHQMNPGSKGYISIHWNTWAL